MKAPQGIEGAVRAAAKQLHDGYTDERGVAWRHYYPADIERIIHRHLDPAVQPLVDLVERMAETYQHDCTCPALQGSECGCCPPEWVELHKEARTALETWRREG